MQKSNFEKKNKFVMVLFVMVFCVSISLDVLAKDENVASGLQGVNDAHKEKLWGLDNVGQEVNGVTGTVDADIDMPEAWDVLEVWNRSGFWNGLKNIFNRGDDEVIIAVIDSGLALNHPDIKKNLWDGSKCEAPNSKYDGKCKGGYDFADEDPEPFDTKGHGTHIAGIIAATGNNKQGIVGVAPNVKIMALRVGGDDAGSTKNRNEAIKFAKDNGATVISASFGSYEKVSSDECENIKKHYTYDAIKNFEGLFVTSVGNDGMEHNEKYYSFPGGFAHDGPEHAGKKCWKGLSNIINVAATDQDDKLLILKRQGFVVGSSDFGKKYVDVAAPGANIYSLGIHEEKIYSEDFSGAGNNTNAHIDDDLHVSGMWGADGKDAYRAVNSKQNKKQKGIKNKITSDTINLTGKKEVRFKFWVYCDTERNIEGEDLELQFYSNDSKRFKSINRGLATNLKKYEGIGANAKDWALARKTILIDKKEYLNDKFKFQFVWHDKGGAGQGCSIDNIEVVEVRPESSEEMYTFKSGTSMAAPYVSGLAGLLWSYNPNLTQEEVKNAILNTGDRLPSLVGKVGTGKRVNVHNAILSVTKDVEDGMIDGAKLKISGMYNGAKNAVDTKISGVVGAYNDTKDGVTDAVDEVQDAIAAVMSFVEGVDEAKRDIDKCMAEIAHVDDKDLATLRHFRDSVLANSEYGLWVIKRYYQISPYVADRLEGDVISRFIVREIVFKPIVTLIKVVESTPIQNKQYQNYIAI